MSDVTHRRRQAASVLGARLRHATRPDDRRIFVYTLDAVLRGADLDLVEAARRRAWDSCHNEEADPDLIIDQYVAELVAMTPPA